MGQFVGIQVESKAVSHGNLQTGSQQSEPVAALRFIEVTKCQIENVIHGKPERLPLLDKNSDGTVPKPLFPAAKILSDSGVQFSWHFIISM